MSSTGEPFLESLKILRSHLWGRHVVEVCEGYSTIDLTLFDLPQKFRPDPILLIREEYNRAYGTILEHTLNQPKRWRRYATIVTGQPGIGKTLFLFYLLVRRLQERQPVAFQLDKDRFALFDEHGVYIHSSSWLSGPLIPKGAWALSDSLADGTHRPCAAFYSLHVHIVHTSSPASCQWKGWMRQLGVFEFIMDVWSLEELRTLLTARKFDVHRGVNLFQKYGPDPRVIVSILLDPTEEAKYLHEVKAAALYLAHRDLWMILFDLEILDFSSDHSSKIFLVRPQSRQPTLYIPTPFLASTLGIAMSRQAAAQQRTFFEMLSRRPSLRSAARWLFKSYAHVYFSDPTRASLEGYLSKDPTPYPIPTPVVMITGSSTLKDIQPPFNFYWRHREPNFNGVDALICSGNVVWALQFATSASHSSAANGLTEVFDIMNHKTGIDLRLVIVGPDLRAAESTRDRQLLTDRWAGIPVYACELPLGELTEGDVQRLRGDFIEANDTYPVDQGANLDVPSMN